MWKQGPNGHIIYICGPQAYLAPAMKTGKRGNG